jgi:hypothetical protein
MEKILKAAKCIDCQCILRSPVLLPCGISVCRSHTTSQPLAYACPSCHIDHAIPNDGFTSNNTCDALIETYFGEKHQRAFDSCRKLSATIDEFFALTHDDNSAARVIDESIGELRAKARAKAERLKVEIDERVARLDDQLDAYQRECKNNVLFVRSASVLREIEANFEEKRIVVDEWLIELNSSLEEESKVKWEAIGERCETEARELFSQLNEAKNVLLMNRFNEFKAKQIQFCQLSLQGNLEWYKIWGLLKKII